MTDAVIDKSTDFIIGGSISLLSWFFGGEDGIIKVLLAFAIIDQISGVGAGFYEDKLSSDAGFKGIFKKCLMFSFVGIANLLDKYVMPDNAEFMRTTVSLFYIANEGISILENADRLGIPIPDFLRKRFFNMQRLYDKKNRTAE
ncbi:MAG: phage holin family protein [Synergistaceae bacterium]|nr:phage holin family protein [Synergistaceae bacterium]